MATIQARVEAIIGVLTSPSDISPLVDPILRKHIDLSPPAKLQPYETNLPTSSQVLSIENFRPLRVIYQSSPKRRCRFIPPDTWDNVTDSGSLNYATAEDPAYSIRSGVLEVAPSASEAGVYGIAYPTNHNYLEDDGNLSYPPDMIDLAVLEIALRVLGHKIDMERAVLTSLTIDVIAKPSNAPADPDFTYNDAVASTIMDAYVQLVLALSTQWSELDTYLDTNKDIELAQAKMNEIQTRIAEFQANLQSQLGLLRERASLETDIAKQNAIYGLQAQVEEYKMILEKYGFSVQMYSMDLQKAIAKFQAQIGQQTQAVNALMSLAQKVTGEYTLALKTYLGLAGEQPSGQ